MDLLYILDICKLYIVWILFRIYSPCLTLPRKFSCYCFITSTQIICALAKKQSVMYDSIVWPRSNNLGFFFLFLFLFLTFVFVQANLLEFATKYCMARLVQLCEDELKTPTHLTRLTLLEIFQLATACGAKQLAAYCEYFARKYNIPLPTPESSKPAAMLASPRTLAALASSTPSKKARWALHYITLFILGCGCVGVCVGGY